MAIRKFDVSFEVKIYGDGPERTVVTFDDDFDYRPIGDGVAMYANNEHIGNFKPCYLSETKIAILQHVLCGRAL